MNTFVLSAHGLVGWVLCGAVMGIGVNVTSLETTLLVHAASIPVIFGVITFFYFKRFSHFTPFETGLVFVGLAVLLDVVIVALLIERSFAMFRSILGTWIPFFLIFFSTYLVGLYANREVPRRLDWM